MKPIAIFVLVAAVSLVTVAASAKTVSAPQNDSERITNTLAGPPPSPRPKASNGKESKGKDQPGKAELKKSRIKPKPPLTDPN